MHKSLHTVSPIRQKPLRICLSVRVSVSPGSVIITPQLEQKSVCFHARMIMMFMSTHVHASISSSVHVASLLPTDGNLRHNAGGLSFEAPFPPPIFPSHPFSLLLPPFPPHPFALTKQKEKLQSYTGRPQNLAAGSGSPPLLLWGDKSSPAFDTITQAERGRKWRCNIHMKSTRLAAM